MRCSFSKAIASKPVASSSGTHWSLPFWPTVAFRPLPNQSQPQQRHPRQSDLLGWDVNAVDGCGMDQHRADVADIHADGYGTRALFGAGLAKIDQSLARQIGDPNATDGGSEFFQARRLAAARGLAHFAHIGNVQLDELTEGAAVANTGRLGALAVRKGALGFERLGFGIRFQAESLRRMGPLRRTCARQQPEGNLL